MADAFKLGDRVYVKHPDMMYDARIIKMYDRKADRIHILQGTDDARELLEEKIDTGESPVFFIHYLRWDKRWDEWVERDQVLKQNKQNREKKDLLKREMRAKKLAASQAGDSDSDRDTKSPPVISEKRTAAKDAAESPAKRQKTSAVPADKDEEKPEKKLSMRQQRAQRRKIREMETAQDFVAKQDLRLACPRVIKELLVDDWKFITEQQIVDLPMAPTVDEVLVTYKKHLHATEPEASDAQFAIWDEVLAGLKQYFNISLGTFLLYRIERPQYFEMRKKYKPFKGSSVYGALHLMRLYVLMPGLIGQTSLSTFEQNTLCRELERFAFWAALNKEEIFPREYASAPARWTGRGLT